MLFKSIDKDHNGHLDKDELQAAFKRAGLAVPNSRLDKFFDDVDTDNDGVISFEEWRYVFTCRYFNFQSHDSPLLTSPLSQ